MLTSMLSLSHAEQQLAAERIHQLMAEGMRSSQAIAQVAQEIRERYCDHPGAGHVDSSVNSH